MKIKDIAVKGIEVPEKEIQLILLIAQREKLNRDEITNMMLAGDEALKMLIRFPSQKLIQFLSQNFYDEDRLLLAIPRYEVPKAEFEAQVLREMRMVLRDNIEKIVERSDEELMRWELFEEFYLSLENFDYPHKDKLLEFIKYFFLDHIESQDVIQLNYQAFKEHIISKRQNFSSERTRNGSGIRKWQDKQNGSESSKVNKFESDDGEIKDEERMLDIAEQCFIRIADLLHQQRLTVKQALGPFSTPENFRDGTILELIGPRSFLAALREIGFDDMTDTEASCLMKVLAKPELDSAVILNEFVLIMENFGIPVTSDDDEYANDYEPDSEIDETAEIEKKPEVR